MRKSWNPAWILGVALPFLAQPGMAQQIDIDFPGLADIAEEVVEVTVDAPLLHLASRFLSGGKPEERAVSDVIASLQGIYVRSYEFANEGDYDTALVDQLRAQIGPGWQPLVSVRSRTRENVSVMANMDGEAIRGLIVIAAEPRSLTVVNIVGSIDLERLAEIQGQFGIPQVTDEPEDGDND